MKRILVTGSRSWPELSSVWAALNDQIRELGDSVIVHGACPSGADYHAYLYAELNGWEQEPHPADWRTHGRRAGPIRNQRMVNLGANVCLAFPLPDSIGTYDCMRRAKKARIKVINYGAQKHA